MIARGRLGTEEAGLGPEELFRPVLDPDDSDSGKLDATVELLVRGGRDVRHAVAMLVPEAWEGQRDLRRGVRDFFRYHACLTDPWDGPAGLVFTDGRRVGAALDRNGLRPLRWQVCDDGLVVCASEVGAVPGRRPRQRAPRPPRSGRHALRRPRRSGTVPQRRRPRCKTLARARRGAVRGSGHATACARSRSARRSSCTPGDRGARRASRSRSG